MMCERKPMVLAITVIVPPYIAIIFVCSLLCGRLGLVDCHGGQQQQQQGAGQHVADCVGRHWGASQQGTTLLLFFHTLSLLAVS